MKQILTLALVVFMSTPALAQQAEPVAMNAQQTQLQMGDYIARIQKEWARIKYQVPDKDTKLADIAKLEKYAEQVSASFPQNPEPKIWEGIVLSTDAGITKSMSGLPKVKKAKALLESALAINDRALDGSAYTSLGSLYYQVPGWPISFGDDEEAEKNLKKALAINPTGIDPNFFYGDFLLKDGRYEEAIPVLQRALQAAPRPDRPLADAGRRQEIQAALVQAQEKMKDVKEEVYN
ncbi:MAG: hypothetical protein H6868_00760 [Rhodospirillales bacterium]|nr:hypothetical protein [Rhodospirillales bacterium]